ncbi:DUF4132 domain-containing protein [Aestuariibaculum sediminum]|uniref:DUF4132 domain-containing protein n=1 Tax=Aestuariibaculum sediminum TaxID=2770637 RepID=A0A8J6U8G1_9FLAO|nr:DUF4132 domain-containing protein [Aestuariibaculum sediminum]MBD0831497.1 DUF4132 domain-containing protein [Aestuariibaculum sediminum]
MGTRTFGDWPIGFTVQQIERIDKKEALKEDQKAFLTKFLKWKQMDQKKHYWGADLEKVRARIEKLLFESNDTKGKTAPYVLPDDRFAGVVNPEVEAFVEEQKDLFYQLFHLYMKASTSKPSKKYLKETSDIIDQIGISKYKDIIHPWLEFICDLKEIPTIHEETYRGHTYTHTTHEFIHEKNSIFLKGLVWSLCKFHDSKTLNIVGKLAERSFKKIPGVGPAAAAVGNACIYVLGHTRGLEGVSHLSRLKLKIKQNNTKNLIIKYLDEASQKLGISSAEIEELSIPDFGLILGDKSYVFDDYQLRVVIEELGKVNMQWIKPDGSVQKTAPSFIKESVKLKEKLKKAKGDVAQIKKYLTAQRDRIDRSYLENRIWTYETFEKLYLNHGLVSFIARRLIWQIDNGESFVSAVYLNDQWEDFEGKVVNGIDKDAKVRLWHPIYASIDEIIAWRIKLETHELKQPLKQAYREVYLLTEAEVNTKSYSNRMAAHIIKQHQFNALAAIRGWRYTLMGAFDNGMDSGTASIDIKAHGIIAEFWINEINDEDAYNDSGIWNYVATDQVRFLKEGEVMDLIDVPNLVLSEIMRDVDLYVGVCSVGNDPEWRDNGGLPQYRDYWTSYSFGDLNEVAKTRKDILEKLLPRLKISKVATIDGKFLKVKGTKRTYKIHMGSSNILMEPNDQYLCIVPARGKDAVTDKVFLPFEGDRGLSLVLSKAFLLAADDKITDPTILSQINR